MEGNNKVIRGPIKVDSKSFAGLTNTLIHPIWDSNRIEVILLFSSQDEAF